MKFHGGTSNTVGCGDPVNYDELIIILGPESVLRPDEATEQFMAYRIPSSTVLESPADGDGHRRYSKRQIPQDCLVSHSHDA